MTMLPVYVITILHFIIIVKYILLITFFKLTVIQPQTGLSGGIPKGDIAIIRGVSTMHVIATEDLQVGQGVELDENDIGDLGLV